MEGSPSALVQRPRRRWSGNAGAPSGGRFGSAPPRRGWATGAKGPGGAKGADPAPVPAAATRDSGGEEREAVAGLLRTLEGAARRGDREAVSATVRELLGSAAFYEGCYEALRGNPGLVARGVAETGEAAPTLDGVDARFFRELADKVRRGRYRWGPLRQVAIPKGSGGSRLLGIAASRDKILQKAMAVILETVAEPTFLDSSHGFRRGRSCHTALAAIKRGATGSSWAVEGDIAACFDSIDHRRLVTLVKKFVDQQVYLDLLRTALKARVVTLTSSFVVRSGTPQGSVLSPLLANVYLHGLDRFLAESPELAAYRGADRRLPSVATHYRRLLRSGAAEDAAAAQRLRERSGRSGARKYWKLLATLRRRRLLAAWREMNRRRESRYRLGAHTRRLLYVRYADDFVVFVWGTKEDAAYVRRRIGIFLRGQLGLKLSEEKTRLTHLRSEPVQFLGLYLRQQKQPWPTVRRDWSPQGRRDSRVGQRYRGATMTWGGIRVLMPVEDVLRKLQGRGMVRRLPSGAYRPTSYRPALGLEIPGIVNYLAAVYRGLALYYGVADNWGPARDLLDYWGRYTAAMTIGHKTKGNCRRVFSRYGNRLVIPDGHGRELARWPARPRRREDLAVSLLDPQFRSDPRASGDLAGLLVRHLRLGRRSVVRHACAICGHPQAEMHHLRSVRTALRERGPARAAEGPRKRLDRFREVMRMANRKVVPLCRRHHAEVHRGTYAGPSLRALADYFVREGAAPFPAAELEALIAGAGGAAGGGSPAPAGAAPGADPTSPEEGVRGGGLAAAVKGRQDPAGDPKPSAARPQRKAAPRFWVTPPRGTSAPPPPRRGGSGPRPPQWPKPPRA